MQSLLNLKANLSAWLVKEKLVIKVKVALILSALAVKLVNVAHDIASRAAAELGAMEALERAKFDAIVSRIIGDINRGDGGGQQ